MNFEDDCQALQVLEKYNLPYRGGIIVLDAKVKYPPEVYAACRYLFGEWDYGVAYRNE